MRKSPSPKGGTTIGVGAFVMCNSIMSIVVPNSVTTLKTGSFQRMAMLEEITFGDGITELENSIFMYDESLTTVRLGKNTEVFDNVIFYTLSVLKAIEVPEENPYFTSVDGVLFNKQMSELLVYPLARPETSYEVPETVWRIGDYAFQPALYLSTVTIPSSVEELGLGAFSGASITTFNFSEGLKTIGMYALSSLEACPSITLPASVTDIDPSAFYLSLGLVSISVAEGNENFTCDDGVLYDHSMTTLLCYPPAKGGSTFTFPESVVNVGDMAFLASLFLEEIDLKGIRSVGEFGFYYSQQLSTVTLGEQMDHIGFGAFADSELLEKVYCYAPALTDVDGEAFVNEYLSMSGTLYVPAGTEEFYAVQPWVYNPDYGMSLFAHIEEMETWASMRRRHRRMVDLPSISPSMAAASARPPQASIS